MSKLKTFLYSDSKFWYWAILLGVGYLYVYNTLPLSDWIIDDAGISFAYSRSFASGHGFVSQPGMTPVEGFSNLTWVILMSLFFLLQLFDPYITPKIISAVIVLYSFYLIHRILLKIYIKSKLIYLFVLLLIATNASIVIWTSSGLENPLYICFILLIINMILGFDLSNLTHKQMYLLAFIVFCTSITRPDGILYIAIFPMYFLGIRLYENKRISRSDFTPLIRYAGMFILLIVLLETFRLVYFNDFLPNTYHVKGGTSIRSVIGILTLQKGYLLKLQELLISFSGKKLWYVLPLSIIIWFSLLIKNKINLKGRFLIVLTYLLSLFIYLQMPVDWMGEYRFASPFYITSALLIGYFCYDLIKLINKKTLKVIIFLLPILFLFSSYKENRPRLLNWYKSKTVNFNTITHKFAYKFNDYANKLGFTNASFLVPDAGGTLYYSDLKIIDLGGLCDAFIAKNRGKNQDKFYDYIFEEIKTTFIHTHGYFTVVSLFDEDERFARDYIAISEYEDKHAFKSVKRKIMSGDYIRKDALDSLQQIEILRSM